MKFKPVYLYLIIAVIAVAVLFIFTNNQKSGKETAESVMPEDDIHKGLKGQMSPPPGKGNVSESIIKQMEELRKASENNPDDTAKIREYADLLGAAHKEDEAIVQYQKILKKDPKRTDLITSIAFIHYNRMEYEQAETLLHQVISIDKNNLQARYNLGAIAANQGDYARAKILWRKIVSDYPGTEMADLAKSSLEKL